MAPPDATMSPPVRYRQRLGDGKCRLGIRRAARIGPSASFSAGVSHLQKFRHQVIGAVLEADVVYVTKWGWFKAEIARASRSIVFSVPAQTKEENPEP